MGEESDGAATSMSELRDQILALTNQKVDILDGDAYKSTYDIMVEMAGVWDEMSNMNQQGFMQLMGVNHANVVASIINNIQDVIDARNTALNDSLGSATRENEKYLDSVEGKMAKFQSSMQQLSSHTFSPDFLKGFLDFGTGVVGVLDNIAAAGQGIPTLFAAIAGSMSAFKNIGMFQMGNNREQGLFGTYGLPTYSRSGSRLQRVHTAQEESGWINNMHLFGTGRTWSDIKSFRQYKSIMKSLGIGTTSNPFIFTEEDVKLAQEFNRQFSDVGDGSQKFGTHYVNSMAAAEKITNRTNKNLTEMGKVINDMPNMADKTVKEVQEAGQMYGFNTNAFGRLGAGAAGLGKTILQQVGMGVLNAGAAMLIGEGLQLGTQLIEYVVNFDTHQISEGLEVIEKFKDSVKGANDNLEILSSIQPRFDMLASGVDEYGRNISLTADQYKEYQDMVKQIVAMSPTLVAKYDNEGNALIRKADAISEATRLQKESIRDARTEYVENGKEVVGRYTSLMKQANELGMKQLNKAVSETGGKLSASDILAGQDLNTAQGWLKVQQDAYLAVNRLEKAGTITAEQAAKARTQIEGIATASQDAASATGEMDSYLNNYAQTLAQYGDLSVEQADALERIISSGKYKESAFEIPSWMVALAGAPLQLFYPFAKESLDTNAFESEIDKYVEAVAKLDNSTLEGLDNLKTGFQDGSIGVEEFTSRVDNLATSIASITGLEKSEVLDVFGFTEMSEQLDRAIEKVNTFGEAYGNIIKATDLGNVGNLLKFSDLTSRLSDIYGEGNVPQTIANRMATIAKSASPVTQDLLSSYERIVQLAQQGDWGADNLTGIMNALEGFDASAIEQYADGLALANELIEKLNWNTEDNGHQIQQLLSSMISGGYALQFAQLQEMFDRGIINAGEYDARITDIINNIGKGIKGADFGDIAGAFLKSLNPDVVMSTLGEVNQAISDFFNADFSTRPFLTDNLDAASQKLESLMEQAKAAHDTQRYYDAMVQYQQLSNVRAVATDPVGYSTAAVEAVTAAMQEQNAQGKLSYETYQKLAAFGPSVASAYRVTAGGIVANTAALKDWAKQQKEAQLAQVDSLKNGATKQMQENAKEIAELQKLQAQGMLSLAEASRLDNLLANQSGLQSTIEGYRAWAAAINEVYGARAQLDSLLSGGTAWDDVANSWAKMGETIDGLRDEGRWGDIARYAETVWTNVDRHNQAQLEQMADTLSGFTTVPNTFSYLWDEMSKLFNSGNWSGLSTIDDATKDIMVLEQELPALAKALGLQEDFVSNVLNTLTSTDAAFEMTGPLDFIDRLKSKEGVMSETADGIVINFDKMKEALGGTWDTWDLNNMAVQLEQMGVKFVDAAGNAISLSQAMGQANYSVAQGSVYWDTLMQKCDNFSDSVTKTIQGIEGLDFTKVVAQLENVGVTNPLEQLEVFKGLEDQGYTIIINGQAVGFDEVRAQLNTTEATYEQFKAVVEPAIQMGGANCDLSGMINDLGIGEDKLRSFRQEAEAAGDTEVVAQIDLALNEPTDGDIASIIERCAGDVEAMSTELDKLADKKIGEDAWGIPDAAEEAVSAVEPLPEMFEELAEASEQMSEAASGSAEAYEGIAESVGSATEQFETLSTSLEELTNSLGLLTELGDVAINIDVSQASMNTAQLVTELQQLQTDITTITGQAYVINVTAQVQGPDFGALAAAIGSCVTQAQALQGALEGIAGVTAGDASAWGIVEGAAAAQQAIDAAVTDIVEQLNSISQVQITIDTSSACASLGKLSSAAASATSAVRALISAVNSANKLSLKSFNTSSKSKGYARGIKSSPGERALVNDGKPVNGSSAELIIKHNTDEAYIANGGKLAMVDLEKGDTVLTAAETQRVMRGGTDIRYKRFGKGNASSLLAQATNSGSSSSSSKGSSSSSKGSSSSSSASKSQARTQAKQEAKKDAEAETEGAKEAWDKYYKDLKHMRAMDVIDDKEYYRRLAEGRNQYLAGNEDLKDELYSIDEELHAGEKSMYKEAAEKEFRENEHWYKMGVRSYRDYINEKMRLNAKYWANQKDYLEEYWSMEEEILNDEKKLFDETYNRVLEVADYQFNMEEIDLGQLIGIQKTIQTLFNSGKYDEESLARSRKLLLTIKQNEDKKYDEDYDEEINNLEHLYKMGKITKEEFLAGLKQIDAAYNTGIKRRIAEERSMAETIKNTEDEIYDDNYNKAMKKLKFQLDTDIIDERQYFKEIDKLNEETNKNKIDRLDEYYDRMAEVYQYEKEQQQKLLERSYNLTDQKFGMGLVSAKAGANDMRKAVERMIKNHSIDDSEIESYTNEIYDWVRDVFDRTLDGAMDWLDYQLDKTIKQLKKDSKAQTDPLQERVDSIELAIKGYEHQKDVRSHEIEIQLRPVNDEVYNLTRREEDLTREYEKLLKPYQDEQKAKTRQQALLQHEQELALRPIDKELNALSRQSTHITQDYEDRLKPLNEELKKLQRANELEQEAIDLDTKRYNLAKARTERVNLVYHAGSGFVYEADKEAIRQAEVELKKNPYEERIKALQREISDLQDDREKALEPLEKRTFELNEARLDLEEYFEGLLTPISDSLFELGLLIEDIEDERMKIQDTITDRLWILQRIQDDADRSLELFNRQIDDKIWPMEQEKYMLEGQISSITKELEKQLDALDELKDSLSDYYNMITLGNQEAAAKAVWGEALLYKSNWMKEEYGLMPLLTMLTDPLTQGFATQKEVFEALGKNINDLIEGYRHFDEARTPDYTGGRGNNGLGNQVAIYNAIEELLGISKEDWEPRDKAVLLAEDQVKISEDIRDRVAAIFLSLQNGEISLDVFIKKLKGYAAISHVDFQEFVEALNIDPAFWESFGEQRDLNQQKALEKSAEEIMNLVENGQNITSDEFETLKEALKAGFIQVNELVKAKKLLVEGLDATARDGMAKVYENQQINIAELVAIQKAVEKGIYSMEEFYLANKNLLGEQYKQSEITIGEVATLAQQVKNGQATQEQLMDAVKQLNYQTQATALAAKYSSESTASIATNATLSMEQYNLHLNELNHHLDQTSSLDAIKTEQTIFTMQQIGDAAVTAADIAAYNAAASAVEMRVLAEQIKAGNSGVSIKDLVLAGQKAQSLPKFASGTSNARGGFAITQEQGPEAILTKSGGRFTFLSPGDKVFSSDQTENLWELSKKAPLLKDSPTTINIPRVETRQLESSSYAVNIGDVIVQQADNPEGLAKAIINRLPNQMLQSMRG